METAMHVQDLYFTGQAGLLGWRRRNDTTTLITTTVYTLFIVCRSGCIYKTLSGAEIYSPLLQSIETAIDQARISVPFHRVGCLAGEGSSL